MSGEVYTTLGTRVLLLGDGGSIAVTKDESELVKVAVRHVTGRAELPLTAVDCLALIEFLAVAARPHSGKPLLDMLPVGDNPPAHFVDEGCWLDTLCSVCGKRQWVSPSGVTCDNGHGGAPPKC